MTTKDRQARSATFRRLLAAGLVTILPVAVILVVLFTREDGQVTRPTLAPSSTAAIPTSTTLDTRTELTQRLVEILKIRDKAFQTRDRQSLKDIYTVDCPCLEGDGNAIQELIDNDYHIVGGATSIRVRRVSSASARLWLIVADFRSAPLRVETKDGKLIREEPGGSELFQFALSKPNGSHEWLLGRATAYRDGSG
jgi:hypothetical protein